MENNSMISTIAQRFHYAVLAFVLGALWLSVSHFGWTHNVLLVTSVCAVGAAANHIIESGYLHASVRASANV